MFGLQILQIKHVLVWESAHPNGICYVLSPYLPDGFSSWMLLGWERRKFYITPPHSAEIQHGYSLGSPPKDGSLRNG